MKKLLLLNLMLLVMGWTINAQTAIAPSSGDGSSTNPYQIATLENLYWISVNKGVWDKHFVQTADIDASATASWPDGGWKPIGTFELDYSQYPFSGTYDGKNHFISGLTINRPSSGSRYSGLFGLADGATIENLRLFDVSIITLYDAGGMCGSLKNCTVRNCQTSGSVTTTINDYGHSTGGLAAILNNSTLSVCQSECNVSGTCNVGGMIGTCSLSTIFDCHSSGNVGHSATTTYSKIGGFAGLVQGSSLSKIFSTGNVTATGDYTSGNSTGGFVGHSSSYFSAPYQSNLISDCYCSGNVSGGSKIGGFVGNNYCASGTSTITKCYSRGIITGTGSVWGFVGENSGTIYNCYFDADVDGLSYTVSGTSVYGSIGKSTAEMKTQSTYTDWDFTSIWGIGEGNNDGYPYLLPSSTCSDGTIVLTSGPESQTVCYGTAISPIVYTIGGGATGAEVSGLPDGLTGALSGETFTITGTSTVSGSFPYTVTTSGTVSPCINATATGTITIFGYSGGNGTESNPFQIATLADLKFLSENSCHWDKHFIQTADIDASATNTWDDGKGWLAIGTSTAPFYGTYDGMLHTISNLYINRPYAGNQGLFGYISNFLTQISMIKNLGVTNVNINARNNIGGLVGFNLGDVSNCYCTGTVVASNVEVGGLVGQNKGSITYCYSEADVTGYWLVGGLVGNTNGYGSEIINCYSRGSVTSVSEGSGGLVGVIMYDALIRNCYSTGLMNNSGAGGLVGLIDGVGSVINSFWDVETSGVTFSAGGTAKTTAEMKTQSTFTGWDFMTIWGINAGNNDGYPHLITESACVDGALYLVSGLNTQTVYTNSSIIPIVYFVGGGASGVSISPATLPPKFSGIYDPVNGTYTISGLCQANYTLNYSLTTTGTKFPCKEATVTGIIKVIIQPSVNITGTNSPICYGSDAKFYLQGTTGVEVTYSLDGGTTTSTVILVEGKATIEVKGATSDKTLSLISARNTEYGCTFPLKGTSAVIVNNLPAASISGDHEGCVSTTLTAGTDASTPIYEWYKEGVLLAGESNSTLVATQAGSYTVKVTDGITKCSNISDDFAVILSTHTVSITANNQPICYGSDAEFFLEGTPGTVVTYSFDGGTSQSTIPLDAGSASVIYKQAVGDVTLSLISIELTATGCARELTETSTVEIYIPTAIISGNQVSCVSTTLTAETDALKPIYEWHKDGALLAGESSSTLTVTQSGAYTLMVSDVSTKCSNISGDFNVTINPLPEVTIIGNNSSICYITDAEFYLEGTPGAEVTYNFNGGTNRTRVLGEGITTVTFDEAPYDITLSLESIYNPSTGCRKFLNTESTVFVNPDPKVSIDGYHEDCQSTTLKAVTDTPNPVYAWLIAEGEEPIQVGDGSTLEVTQSDDYYLFVTDKITRCFGFSGPFAVTINPLPAVAITGNTELNVGGTTNLSPTDGGIWVSNDPTVAMVDSKGEVTGISIGSATFTFTDSDTGCSATTEAVTVTSASEIQSQAFTSSGQFTIPNGVYTLNVKAWGGGGGGSGRNFLNPIYVGGSGGGGGGFCGGTLHVSPGEVISITVGQGGSGGGDYGVVGSNSVINGDLGTITAYGGWPGQLYGKGGPGKGGTYIGTVENVKIFTGGDGYTAVSNSAGTYAVGGGGGGGAGDNQNGGHANLWNGGGGGTAFGGKGGNGNSTANGEPGSAYGGGGAGGSYMEGFLGGNGANGAVIIEWTVATPQPTITVTPTTLSGFTYVEGSGPSANKSFTITGLNLTSDVTITPLANYEISREADPAFNPESSIGLSFDHFNTGGSQIIFVRLKAGLIAGNYNEEIAINSIGANPKTVTCSGTVIGLPTLTISPTSLSGLTYVEGSGPSDIQSFNVGVANLTHNLIISSTTTHFEISASYSPFVPEDVIQIAPHIMNAATLKTFFVRLKAGLTAGNYNTVIDISSEGAESKSVSCSGVVPSSSLYFSEQPSTASQTICLGFAATTLSVNAIGSGTLDYQWYSNTAQSNAGGVEIGGATGSSYTPSTAFAGVLYYYVEVSDAYGNSFTSNVSGAVIVKGYSGGDGSEDNPFLIATLNDLQFLSENDCHWDKHFIQTADINAFSTSEWNSGAGFSPIGGTVKQFTGFYDGNGKTISGITIKRPLSEYQGMFGAIKNASLQNIKLLEVNILGQNYTGGLVGIAIGSSISNSSATGNVTGNQFVGGLVGYSTNDPSVVESYIIKCYSTCQVQGSGQVGGLVGINQASSITFSYATGPVSGVKAKVGGLAGSNSLKANISYSYSTSQVYGDDEAGGLVGLNEYESEIRYSYSTGRVTGFNYYIGGLVGKNYIGATNDSYWDIETSGTNLSEGGTGKTTAEMKTKNTFFTWNFTTTWAMAECSDWSYPYLVSNPQVPAPGLETTKNPSLGGTIAANPTSVSSGAVSIELSSSTPASGHIGILQYQWQISSDDVNYVNITGADSDIYTYEGTLTQNSWFRRQAKVHCQTEWVPSNHVAITVISDLCTNPTNGGEISGNQAICAGSDPAAFTNIADASGYTGTLEYKWQYSEVNDPFNWQDLSESNSAGFDDSQKLNSARWYRRLARVDCSVDWTAAAESNKLEVTVNPLPTLTSFSVDNTKFCIDDSYATVRITYDGLLNTDNTINVTFITRGNLVGTITTDLEITQSMLKENLGSYYFEYLLDCYPASYQIIVNSITANGCTTTFNESEKPAISWNIYLKPTVSISELVYCGTTILTVQTDAVNASFSWYKYNGSELTPIPGVTSSTLEVTESGTYSVEITNTETGCSNGTWLDVIVYPLPTASISGDLVACGGTILTAETDDKSPSYIWRRHTETGYVFITEATGSTLEVTQSGTYSVKIINTETGCTKEAFAVVTVNPLPTLSSITVDKAESCYGTAVTVTIDGLVAGPNTINYDLSSNGGGAINNNLDITASEEGVYNFEPFTLPAGNHTLIIKSIKLGALAEGEEDTRCSINEFDENAVSWTVNSCCTNPTNGGEISGNQAICAGNDPVAFTNITDASGYTGTLEYKWQYSEVNDPFNWQDFSEGNSAGFDDSQKLNSERWYRRLARVDCSADWTAAAESNIITVTVDEVDAGIMVYGPTTFCEGGSVTLAALGGNSWLWSNGEITPEIVVTTSDNYSVTITNENGCSASTSPLSVTVNPKPTFSGVSVDNESSCFDPDINPVLTFSGLIPGENNIFYAINEEHIYEPLTLVADENGIATHSFDLGVGTFIFSIDEIRVNGGCKANPVENKTVTWTVYAIPTANANSGGNACGLDFVLNATPSVGIGTWTQESGAGTAGFSPNSNDPDATVTVDAYGSYLFRWTENNGPCSDFAEVTVNFYQPYEAIAGFDQAQCNNSVFTISAGSLTKAAIIGPSGIWEFVGEYGGAIITDKYSETTTVTNVPFDQDITLRWTLTNGTCSDFDEVVLRNNSLPTVDAGSFNDVCVDAGNVILVGSPPGGVWSGTGVSGNQTDGYVFDPTGHVGYNTLTYIYTDGNFCSNSDQATIHVNYLPDCFFYEPGSTDGDPVLPNSTHFYTTHVSGGYKWTIEGNGRIKGYDDKVLVEVIAGENCNEPYTLSLTVTNYVTHCSSTCSKEIKVSDTEAPFLVDDEVTPASLNISGVNECLNVAEDWSAVQLEASVAALYKDNCDTEVSATLTGEPVPGTNNSDCAWSFTYTFIVADNCGNNVTCDVTRSGGDTENPQWAQTMPADITVECDEVPSVATIYATDNCDTNVEIQFTEDRTDGACLNSYTLTRKWTATDNCLHSITHTQVITVQDTEAPYLIVPTTITAEYDPSKSGALVQYVVTANDDCSGPVSPTIKAGSLPNGSVFPFGTTNVTWEAEDACGNKSEKSFDVIVNPASTNTFITVESLPDASEPVSQQYSDLVKLKVVIENGFSSNGEDAASGVNFYIAGQLMNDAPVTFTQIGETTDMAAEITVPLLEPQPDAVSGEGSMQPGVKTVRAVLVGINDALYNISDPADKNLIITQEHAVTEYTGQEFVGEQNPEVTTTPLILSASVTDINDGYRGDIRNARVQFYDVNTLVPISDWLTPGLVDPTDFTQGLVMYIWDAPVPVTGYNTFTIGVKVGTQNPEDNGYYVGSDKSVVNVYRTDLYEFITGGGHIIPTDSRGTYASDPGRKVNFGFNVKWNKTMKRLQGNLNLVFRIGAETYQVKTNSMTSLSINSVNPCSQQAYFTSKANLTRVTSAGIPEEIKGNLDLQVTMTNNTSPGAISTIGVTVYDGNTLLYSSNWPVNQTEELPLEGGNIVVHNGITCVVNNQVDVMLYSSKNPSFVGEEVIFEAVVTPKGSSLVPEGEIVFRDNEVVLGTVTMIGGKAALSVESLIEGEHQLVAEYIPSGEFEGAVSNTLIQQVNGAVIQLESNKNPSNEGDPVTFTATIIGPTGGATPTGKIAFTIGEMELDEVYLIGGKASIVTSDLSAGSHTITAVYSGDLNYDLMTAEIIQAVNSNVVIQLSSSKNPEQVNNTVTFIATVASSGIPVTSADVSFYVNGKELVKASTDGNGVAKAYKSFNVTGTYLIEVRYAGQTASLSQVIKNKVKSAVLATAIETGFKPADLKVYPNPFSDRLNFEFVSPADDQVRIDILDLSGRRIETVFDNSVKAGVTYNAVLVPDKMISGIYLYRMVIGDKVSNGKVIFNRK